MRAFSRNHLLPVHTVAFALLAGEVECSCIYLTHAIELVLKAKDASPRHRQAALGVGKQPFDREAINVYSAGHSTRRQDGNILARLLFGTRAGFAFRLRSCL